MILLDTSFIVAFHNSRDVHHAAAKPVMSDILSGKWGQALLLEYIFLEVATVLLARRGLSVASSVASVLLQAREIDFIPCSEIFLDMLETFRNQRETKLSFAASVITQNRPLVISSKPANGRSVRDIDSAAKPFRLARHEQCLERRETTTSHSPWAARLVASAHRATNRCAS